MSRLIWLDRYSCVDTPEKLQGLKFQLDSEPTIKPTADPFDDRMGVTSFGDQYLGVTPS